MPIATPGEDAGGELAPRIAAKAIQKSTLATR